MKILILFLLFVFIVPDGFTQERNEAKPEWKIFFDKYDATGTILVVDARESPEKISIYNKERANKRYSPASTFKIPHTLFALDAGLVKDEFQVFPWDGVKRGFEPHNQDQNLRSAMRNSALWVYAGFAKELGEEKTISYLKKIDYGNIDPSTESGAYWVDGKLAISASEQITFLQKLFHNDLPFQIEHQRLLKDILIVEAEKDWILRAKTGWEGRYGWWVGWVEWPSGPVYFALNIDTPNRLQDLYKREAIVRDVLKAIQALPLNK
ncbi:class D beta-lactamase [Motilimonas sp. 1_MG-2023]|uniref:class D beta-lactamase n=1 Tax=Motilimonas sp. 1_MG-2023 TaxID=3062672 RepID=UPI0026E2964D|nr:class D beta-lactamase [Motilimonas sp. 1_MG-2023]MDO6525775.1 class D beta-lactamase [Motilimonas sp. 1_MG-2023]